MRLKRFIMRLYHQCNNRENCLLLFGGFAAHPSHFLPFIPQGYDCIIVYHYRHLDFSALKALLKEIGKESKITLLGFSMGVFAARVFLESLQDDLQGESQDFMRRDSAKEDSLNFVRKIAINGTEFGIHLKFGILPRLFKLTQKSFDLESFKCNLFGEFLDKANDFVFRDSKVLREELGFFIQSCAQFDKLTNTILWDQAIISKQDLVFNPEAQRAFWDSYRRERDKSNQILEIDAPHFAFFKWQL